MAGKIVVGRSFNVTSGKPRGVIQFNRLNQFQYITNVDTLEFSLQFLLIVNAGDTVKSKRFTKFKIVPTLPYETATFGIGGQHSMPDAEGSEFRIQTIDTALTNREFNFQNVKLRTISYSGVNVVLENNSASNQLYLKNNNPNIDTINIYAETFIIKGGFRFPGTTINIYAKDLKFETSANGDASYLSTTPLPAATKAFGSAGRDGQKAGDVHLHILNFTANPGRRFILNGGDGEDSDQPQIGDGGDAGNLFSTLDVSSYMVAEGGYSGSKRYLPPALYKGNQGSFTLDSSYASWLHPNFLHLIKNYNKEGFYSGVTEPVVKNLRKYCDIIEAYAVDGSIFKLEEDNLLQIRQIVDEIDQVFFNISNNLDYYGNPPGWVPMLSFEVSNAAYKSEINHALNVLFLDHLVQNANNNLLNRQAAFTQLRSEAQIIVEDSKTDYDDLAFSVIPDIKNNIQANQDEIVALKEKLSAINYELDSRANQKYHDRQTWKWVGVGAKVLSSIPTPYTQAAGAALTIGTQVFANEDQKKGFEQGGALAGVITTAIEPFTSGKVTGEVSTLGSNVSTGVSSIFSQISNINSISDVKKIANDSKKLYDDNKALFQSVSQSVNGVVDLYNSVTRVNADELGSIKGELLANEPRIGIIAEEMKNIADDQQKLGHQLETSTQQMLSSKNNVYTGLSAISHFNDQVFDASSAYDHKLSVFSNDMRRKAFERLRKYHYYMLKAYEYRTIDTTLGSLWGLNLTSTLNKIDKLIDSGRTNLGASDIGSLKAIYDEEIHLIAEKIYDYYQSNQAGKTSTSKIRLTSDEIKSLNAGQTITLNLVDKGLFSPDKEDLRIGNLQVSKIVLKSVINPNTGLYDQLGFKFDYPNYSRIKKNGMLYNFNNYNLHTEQPISWGTDYDLYSQSYTHVVTSDASKSLLSSLFEDTSGANQVDLFARPAAWADIKLSMNHTTDGTSIVSLDSLFIDVQYDFQYKPANIINVELNTSNKWFAPTFAISKTDKYNRKNGIGNVYRAYTQSTANSNSVSVTTPVKYGRFNFTNWATRTGLALTNGNGIDISGGNTLKFSVSTDRSFRAMYKFEGAILDIPDTVYLGDTTQYTLQIKNIGSGALLWNLDSNSNWINYPKQTGINDTTLVLNFERNPDLNKGRIGLLDVSSTETELLHHYIYFIQNKGILATVYTFNGNGNWSTASNWSNDAIPPSILSGNVEIIINPTTNGECVLDVIQRVINGAKISISSNKKFRITGGLDIK